MTTTLLTEADCDEELQAWTARWKHALHEFEFDRAMLCWKRIEHWLDKRLTIPTQRRG